MEFRCEKLKEKLTVGRCKLNQRDALEFFGPEAARFGSCPCEQGIKMVGGDMPKVEACKNCERILNIIGKGLCGTCYQAQAKETTDEGKIGALARVKVRLAGIGRDSKSMDKDDPDQHKGQPAEPEKSPTITLIFKGPDARLYSDLCGMASRLRRTPEQQILFMIDGSVQAGQQA